MDTLNQLYLLNEVVQKLQATNSSNDKKQILHSYSGSEELKNLLFYVFNPFYKFGVTSDNILKYENSKFNKSDLNDVYETNLINCLDLLRLREKTGYDAILSALKLIYEYPQFRELLLNVFDKDLKTGISTKIINEVFPGLIPEFDVALATELSKVNKFNIDEKNRFFVSRKMDGVRVICIIDNNSRCQFLSRGGNEFLTLSKLEEEIQSKGLKNIVLDGEVCLIDNKGMENFQLVVGEIKKKDYTIETPIYKLFDCLSPEEFFAKSSKKTTAERYNELNNLIDGKDFKLLQVLEQKIIASEDELNKENDEALMHGWEGLILRKENANYEGKRTKEMIKVKKMYDSEFEVLSLEYGKKPMLENGVMIEKECLSSAVINYKGYQVNVGSGFSNEDRLRFYENPTELVGKMITVQYFEETTNKDGTISLRFPVFKGIRNYE